MIFAKNSAHEIKNLYLHDAILDGIFCSYADKRVTISFKHADQKNTPGKLDFENVMLLLVPIASPWGEGYYINEITGSLDFAMPVADQIKTEQSDNLFLTSILLNSGDEIKILASKLTNT